MTDRLQAGAAQVNITPQELLPLAGFSGGERRAEGCHDPLLASALCLRQGNETLLFIACDLLEVSRAMVRRVRGRVSARYGLPPHHILISATHTHSGPHTHPSFAVAEDCPAIVPDEAWLRDLEQGVEEAAAAALRSLVPAEALFAQADGHAAGGNRRSPGGPADPALSLMLLREREGGKPIALHCVFAMHPTVLHRESCLYSADFPGALRSRLQAGWLEGAPLIYHTGAGGNQSPRHRILEHSFAEAERIGAALAAEITAALEGRPAVQDLPLRAGVTHLDLPLRRFPPPHEVQALHAEWQERLEKLRSAGAGPGELRTAEVDLIGAEVLLELSRAQERGDLTAFAAANLPAEVQALAAGEQRWLAWPGEAAVEYALMLKAEVPHLDLITLANGGLGGYIVTPEIEAEGGYEALSGLFTSAAGALLCQASRRVLARLL